MKKHLFLRARDAGFGVLLLAVSACAMLAPNRAEAYVLCDVSTLCSTTVQLESQAIQSRISAMEEAVSEAVDRASAAIVKAIGNSTAALSSSFSKNTENAGQFAADMQQNKDNNTISTSHPEINCGNGAASQGPRSGGSSTSEHASGPGSAYQPSNVSKRWRDAMNAGQQTSTPVPPSDDPGKIQADVGQGGCETWSDPNSVYGLLCGSANMSGKNMNPYKDANIKAATLFDGPQDGKTGLKVLSVPASGPMRDARSAYLTSINNANPPFSPKPAQLNTPAGKAYMGLRTEYEASKSMASYPSMEFDRLTTVDASTKSALTLIGQTDQPFLNRYFQGMDSSTFANGVSPLMLMDIEVERRIGNPDWMTRMAAADDKEKEAEMLMIQAYGLRIMRDQLSAQYQTNVLLGKLLNASLEGTSREKIDEVGTALSMKNAVSSANAMGHSAPAADH